MASISENENRKFADKAGAMANETIEKGKANVERSTRAVEQSYTATVDNMRDYNLKMLDVAQVNIEAAFGFARELATAKSPTEVMEVWSSYAKKQFELLNQQAKDLTALGQKISGESAAPIVRSVNQAFSKAS